LKRLVNRSLTFIVVAASVLRVMPDLEGSALIFLALAPPIVLIWFPEQVDEYTFETWYKGNRIDSHTPPLMIALFGWILLLLEASVVFAPKWVKWESAIHEHGKSILVPRKAARFGLGVALLVAGLGLFHRLVRGPRVRCSKADA
jgi:hypothetical protein